MNLSKTINGGILNKLSQISKNLASEGMKEESRVSSFIGNCAGNFIAGAMIVSSAMFAHIGLKSFGDNDSQGKNNHQDGGYKKRDNQGPRDGYGNPKTNGRFTGNRR